jgi:hypothetical protein
MHRTNASLSILYAFLHFHTRLYSVSCCPCAHFQILVNYPGYSQMVQVSEHPAAAPREMHSVSSWVRVFKITLLTVSLPEKLSSEY